MANFCFIPAATCIALCVSTSALSQGVKIGAAGNPHASSVLELQSGTQGFLPPRMTTAERNAIASPAPGLIVFNTTTNCIEYFNLGQWFSLCGSCPNPATPSDLAFSAEETSITWNWGAVAGVDEYRYNTVNTFSGATSNGSSSSLLQTGLSCGTTYSLYVWAVNACGVSPALYLEAQTDACPNPCGLASTVTDINGNVYNTVGIGSQCWMKENLKAASYRNGDAIPYVTQGGGWAGLSSGAWGYYMNNSGNNALYGKLYNWFAVADSRGICPTGWHVPTYSEWNALVTSQGGPSIAGGKLKSVSGWASPNVGADNSSGFTALPGGYRNENGDDGNATFNGFWWTSTALNATNARHVALANNATDAYEQDFFKKVGFSVRCIKD